MIDLASTIRVMMTIKKSSILLLLQSAAFCSFGSCLQALHSFGSSSVKVGHGTTQRTCLHALQSDEESATPERRAFFKTAFTTTLGLVMTSLPVSAEEGDLTSQMFNADGSLKEGIENEAKFRTVKFSIDPAAERVVCVDGVSPNKGSVQVSYELPLKWEDGENLYFDKSEGINSKACNRIIVYQAPGKVLVSQLEKATRIGIAKALDITDDLSEVKQADLIGGRTIVEDGQKYFQFDLGLAPKTCADSPDNLGLGFCPFESLYLLSGTVMDDRLYVFALQCDKSEWKRANAELRRVRSTFSVQQAV
uniref:PsbP C-terminal domain-containing protein n=1 Tax=Amphora coffeiformis TaxID=265554 RepID=A0A7S3KZS0_9STRA